MTLRAITSYVQNIMPRALRRAWTEGRSSFTREASVGLGLKGEGRQPSGIRCTSVPVDSELEKGEGKGAGVLSWKETTNGLGGPTLPRPRPPLRPRPTHVCSSSLSPPCGTPSDRATAQEAPPGQKVTVCSQHPSCFPTRCFWKGPGKARCPSLWSLIPGAWDQGHPPGSSADVPKASLDSGRDNGFRGLTAFILWKNLLGSSSQQWAPERF